MSDQDTEVKTAKRGRPKLDRKPAPAVSVVDDVYRDPRQLRLKQAWDKLAKEKGWNAEQLAAEKKEWHPYFSAHDADPETMEAEGYVPFMVSKDGKTSKQERDRGDLLWLIKADEAERRIEAPGHLASQMLRDTLDAKSEKYQTDFDKNPA